MTERSRPDTDRRPPRDAAGATWRGIVSGLVAAVVALGVAELVASVSTQWRSPVLDVGDRVVDQVPAPVKDLAIDWFGTADKTALLVGIGVLLALYAAVVGVLALRGQRAVGVAGVAVFGVIGAAAALGSRDDRPVTLVLPSLVGAAAGAAALWWLCTLGGGRAATARSDPDEADETDETDEPLAAVDVAASRRAFLGGASVLLAVGTVAGLGGRWLALRFSAAAARAKVVLPRPSQPLAPVPAAASVDVSGVSPFVTPNADFYRIDTALVVPQVDPEDWTLRIDGMVDTPIELTYAQLLDRDIVEADITLSCVSNEVGGDLVGNARWTGVRLDELLAEVGVSPDADQVVGRSVDGFTCGFPVSALDGRDALVAIGMNGEPLPVNHGFPARLIVPGLYGYVSATKWLRQIELTRFDAFDQYWVPRGWDAQAPVKTASRIDTPKDFARIPAGTTAVAGVAWAPTRGIERVEVSIDDGPWQRARLAEQVDEDTWRQWVLSWDATPGRHTLAVRATDGTGETQTAELAEPAPNGATGHHRIEVEVEG